MTRKGTRIKIRKTRCFKCGVRDAGHLKKPHSPYCSECEPRKERNNDVQNIQGL